MSRKSTEEGDVLTLGRARFGELRRSPLDQEVQVDEDDSKEEEWEESAGEVSGSGAQRSGVCGDAAKQWRYPCSAVENAV